MESINFDYNYSLLSAVKLRANGVSSFAQLREVFEDEDSVFQLLKEDKYPVYSIIGFTRQSIPLKMVFSSIEATVVFLDSRVASKREIIEEFCKYCR